MKHSVAILAALAAQVSADSWTAATPTSQATATAQATQFGAQGSGCQDTAEGPFKLTVVEGGNAKRTIEGLPAMLAALDARISAAQATMQTTQDSAFQDTAEGPFKRQIEQFSAVMAVLDARIAAELAVLEGALGKAKRGLEGLEVSPIRFSRVSSCFPHPRWSIYAPSPYTNHQSSPPTATTAASSSPSPTASSRTRTRARATSRPTSSCSSTTRPRAARSSARASRSAPTATSRSTAPRPSSSARPARPGTCTTATGRSTAGPSSLPPGPAGRFRPSRGRRLLFLPRLSPSLTMGRLRLSLLMLARLSASLRMVSPRVVWCFVCVLSRS
ncbi:hypothetical protein IMZ48_13610 [Candidatus Bathyarchaeota archaeon]|nr:hypothetical protein [Candidatus Bathyarchaeota archaeon]